MGGSQGAKHRTVKPQKRFMQEIKTYQALRQKEFSSSTSYRLSLLQYISGYLPDSPDENVVIYTSQTLAGNGFKLP